MQNIPWNIPKLVHKTAIDNFENIPWNILICVAVCYDFIPFEVEYSMEYSARLTGMIHNLVDCRWQGIDLSC